MARKKKVEEIVETNNVVENEVIEKEKVEDVVEIIKETKKTTKKTMTVVNCGALRIRKEANLNSEVLGTVAAGGVVEILAEDDKWITTKDGYMLKEFLR